MIVLIPQTRDEKIAMYMRCKKKELAEMLYNCNEALEMYMKQHPSIPQWTDKDIHPDKKLRNFL